MIHRIVSSRWWMPTIVTIWVLGAGCWIYVAINGHHPWIFAVAGLYLLNAIINWRVYR